MRLPAKSFRSRSALGLQSRARTAHLNRWSRNSKRRRPETRQAQSASQGQKLLVSGARASRSCTDNFGAGAPAEMRTWRALQGPPASKPLPVGFNPVAGAISATQHRGRPTLCTLPRVGLRTKIAQLNLHWADHRAHPPWACCGYGVAKAFLFPYPATVLGRASAVVSSSVATQAAPAVVSSVVVPQAAPAVVSSVVVPQAARAIQSGSRPPSSALFISPVVPRAERVMRSSERRCARGWVCAPRHRSMSEFPVCRPTRKAAPELQITFLSRRPDAMISRCSRNVGKHVVMSNR